MTKEKTLKELDAPPVQQAPLCTTVATLQAPLELKSGLIHLVYFSMKLDRITEEQIKLRAFPFSLKDATKKWLFYLPTGYITSWEQMMKTFLERYYPASCVNNVRRELFGIKQHTHETLFDYWEHFKELCASCPQHGIPEQAFIKFFYEGLLPNARSSINGVVGGSLAEKTPTEAKRLNPLETALVLNSSDLDEKALEQVRWLDAN
ncbi:DNA-directed DNA polymerase [Senna tora]|uniref:DNA-directed DNA polymerase n=1 Tax=Senna tora TaxID=362788 RepID=A0A835CI35_9FABA|nr:DNA-directed DNA polymerase [Senna tora]